MLTRDGKTTLNLLKNNIKLIYPDWIYLKRSAIINIDLSLLLNNQYYLETIKSNNSSNEFFSLNKYKLNVINSSLFKAMPNLSVIFLKENQINQIEENSFSRLNLLKYLFLTSNQLIKINKTSFSGIFSLKLLDLRFNLIEISILLFFFKL